MGGVFVTEFGHARSVLVTGGGGFLGRAICRAAAQRGARVTAIDAAPEPAGFALEGIRYVQASITDSGAVDDAFTGVDTVVHAAAVVGVAAGTRSPRITMDVNVLGSVTVFDAAVRRGVRRVLDLSSEETYGAFDRNPMPEDGRQEPNQPYGISKLATEMLGGYYAREFGLPYAAARLSWVYGPEFPRARLPQSWIEDIVAGVSVSRLAAGSEQLVDLTYVDDAVSGVLALADAETLRHRFYNVASGVATGILELGAALRALEPAWRAEVGDGLLDLTPTVKAVQKGAMDLSRMNEELGWWPTISLEEGLRRTIAAARSLG
jgi:nucleoside-diphosphate-sugar epimerase